MTHMAAAAVINAVWDLYARQQNKPLWRLLADMSPREIVRLVDFRYIDDAITEAEALALLEAQPDGKGIAHRRASTERVSRLHHVGGMVRFLR